MGNLFLREKENWWAWLLWGGLGAVVTLYVASVVDKLFLIPVTALAVTCLLTWWMHQTRRFDFLRAFKVVLFVLSTSIVPAFILVLLPQYSGQLAELTTQVALFSLLGLCACLLCAWIAKRPRQYY